METLTDSLKLGVFMYLAIFGPLTLQVAALYYGMRATSARVIRSFGWNGLMLISWIGTPVHELGHALAVVCLGGKLKEVNLFKADKTTGQLGEVAYSFKKKAPVREAIVAIAPLIGGTGLLFLLTWLLMPDAVVFPKDMTIKFSTEGLAEVPVDLALSLYDNFIRLIELLVSAEVLRRWQTWLWVYLVICIGTRLAPSAVDFKKTWWVLIAGMPVCLLAGTVLVIYKSRALLYEKPFVVGWAEGKIGRPVLVLNSCLSMTLILCMLAAGIIFLVTIPFYRKRA